jgi:hypothetical protein
MQRIKRSGKLIIKPVHLFSVNQSKISNSTIFRKNPKFTITAIINLNPTIKPLVSPFFSKNLDLLQVNFELSEKSERSINQLSQAFPENCSDIPKDMNESFVDSDFNLKSGAESRHKSSDSGNIKNKTKLILSNNEKEFFSYQDWENSKKTPVKYNIIITPLENMPEKPDSAIKDMKIKEFLQISVKSPLDQETQIRKHSQSLPKIIKRVKSSSFTKKISFSSFQTPQKPNKDVKTISRTDKTLKLFPRRCIKGEKFEKNQKIFMSSISLTNKKHRKAEASPYSIKWEKKILKKSQGKCLEKSSSMLPEMNTKKFSKIVLKFNK